VFAPIANPFPDFTRAHDAPGSTIYTNSVVSINATTGIRNWHYQAVPRDEHDWDLSPAPTLYRSSAGKDFLAIAGKSGRLYVVDRATKMLAARFDPPIAGTTLENDDEPLDPTT